MGIQQELKIVQLFHNLFETGFHLGEALDFLDHSGLLAKDLVVSMRQGMQAGQSFSSILGQLGFSETVVSQLALAELHGNILESLAQLEGHLQSFLQVRRKLVAVGTYPLLLLGFLLVIIWGLQSYVLPEIDQSNQWTRLVEIFPLCFITLMACLALGVVGFVLLYRHQKRLDFLSMLATWPGLSGFVKAYLSASLAREWACLFGQGLALAEIVELMRRQKSVFLAELGTDLAQALSAGISLAQQIRTYPFLRQELALMIEYGEFKSRLGQELAIYSRKTWEEFFHRLFRLMDLIQPCVFVLVAFLILLLYAAMLLPIYQNLEVPI
ncbi:MULTISPECIES: competence type IV pilus assembly protein ComGB [unclassified Streptococcus]|uniref:competence type IV pilus assembly protein ComGB n=1 Tax=unclassified Streptococcus TaxID=2608887 RepID=UPI001071F29C|nr:MULTISPECIES: competence type IV pilus assembly protein ComGB [unclassified Streptococcus]TFU28552.1 type II secretion system F family protein [Streptococcus sp. WM07]